MSVAGPLVLVVEDEPQMRKFLRVSLTAHGYRFLESSTGGEGLLMASTHAPDLVLLDLGLPDMDGVDLTKRLREFARFPIIILSARGREEDKVAGLDAGADDYLTKPFGVPELLARMRVALRHASPNAAVAPVLSFGELVIDRVRREVHVQGREVHLTPIQYKLLVYLAENAGKVVTHRQIVQHVWEGASTPQAHHVRVHMAELRGKIEVNSARPRWLLTEQGVGYRFRE